VGIEEKEIAAADFDLPDFGADGGAAGGDFNDDRLSVESDGGLHGELVNVSLEVFFALPALFIETLKEVALAVEEAYADEGDVEIGGAFDVVAGKHTQAAGVNGERLVKAKFGGEISHGAGTKDARIRCAPGAVSLQIFLTPAVDVIDAAVQDEFGGTSLD